MTAEERDDRPYLVVVNHEEQYSIWMKHKPLPLGWVATGVEGSKEQCLDHIDKTWTDMRPLSVRRSTTAPT